MTEADISTNLKGSRAEVQLSKRCSRVCGIDLRSEPFLKLVDDCSFTGQTMGTGTLSSSMRLMSRSEWPRAPFHCEYLVNM